MAEGLKEMGGSAGELRFLLDTSIRFSLRRECIDSMYDLYEKLFSVDSLGDTCFMWWEYVLAYGPPGDNSIYADREIASLMIDINGRILNIDNVECKRSALHGLGHLAPTWMVDVARVIDAFLNSNRAIDAELKSYALAAKRGAVQ
jgi:hypothetical protein